MVKQWKIIRVGPRFLCIWQHEVNVPGTFRTKRDRIHRSTPLKREVPGTLTGTLFLHENLGRTLWTIRCALF